MKNQIEISYKGLINKMNEDYINSTTIEVDGCPVEVVHFLSINELAELADRIIGMVFTEDGEYVSILRDFFFRLCVLFAYTNVPFPDELDSETLEELYKLIYNTDFYARVIEHINKRQYDELVSTIDYEVAAKLKEHNGIVGVLNRFSRGLNELLTDENVALLKEAFGNINNTSSIDSNYAIPME